MSDVSRSNRPDNLDREFVIGRHGKWVVWLNSKSRSITLSPPRYQDQQGAWRDGGFFVNELPMVIFALQQALAYCYATPIPSQENDPLPKP